MRRTDQFRRARNVGKLPPVTTSFPELPTRNALRILVLLLAGAPINVLVAWASARWGEITIRADGRCHRA